jgi:D-glycero-D-manno-heptose 1,7-bisphosphate phosphatase
MPMRQLRLAVFLDRDGVLNEAVVRNGKPLTPASLAEVHIPPGPKDGLLQLKEQEFLFLGITNQPDAGAARSATRSKI